MSLPRQLWLRVAPCSLGLWVASCGDREASQDVALTPFAAVAAPLSEYRGVILLDDRTTCTVESYDHRIHCTDASGNRVSQFGRQGDGPGEFRRATILRGPARTIGVVDNALGRMSLFDVDGALLSEVRLPEIPLFRGSSSFSSTLVGASLGIASQSGPPMPRYRHMELDIESGEIVWERIYPSRFEPGIGCPRDEGFLDGVGFGTFSPTGGIAFNPCGGQILFFADRDDAFGVSASAPGYVPEYPSEREVREYLASAGEFAMEERFRLTPKQYRRSFAFDERGRLWVLTTRRDEAFSYFDLFVDAEYWGSAQVRPHAVGFDLLGGTLAVLVDRPVGPDDEDGYPDRGVDLYYIGDAVGGRIPGSLHVP